MGMQQGSLIIEVDSHVTEAPATRVGKRHYHDLQEEHAWGYSTVLQCRAV
jgi:hypothetical protein